MKNEAIIEFENSNPDAKITFKKKPHGTIVYVNGATAYNKSDIYSFNSHKTITYALEQALKRSKGGN